MIKNVIFDLGGVLLNLDKQRCIDAFTALGFPQIEKLIDLYHPAAIFNALERGDATPHEVCDYIRREAGKPELTDAQIIRAYEAFLCDIPRTKLDMILRLRSAGIRTYLLSNTNAMVWGDVESKFLATGGRPIGDYFNKIYLSYELRDLKPSPTIFEKVIADSGVDPAETLFIDDGLRNVETALELGFSVYMPQPREEFGHLFDDLLK